MATIWLECPDTLHLLSSEIETDPRTFESLPEVPIRTQCPHCGREHTWWISEGWLGAHDALTADTDYAPDGTRSALPELNAQ